MDDLLISLIFFFGAIFVFAMGTVMRRMITTLKENTELTIAKEMAEQSGRAKSSFLATMSHEIRTPMNSILGFTELALDDDLAPQTKDYLNRILDNTNLLLYIINDILDASKIEAGKIELENIPFDLHSVFMRCQSIILPSIKKKGLELIINTQPLIGKMLLGDPFRLTQALMNLLSNAVKFTANGTVSFTSIIKNFNDNRMAVYFEVADSGIGMSPPQLDRIFEPFTQADSSTMRNYGGTGLGLTITKSIIELMGGELAVKSSPGFGSTFSFELKLDTVDVTEESFMHAEHTALEKPHFEGLVLICEDNEMNQQLICEHLARVGLSTLVAENGKVGLELVQERINSGQKNFDLILMDIFMPVMDGVEAAAKIDKLGTATPIVAMTANIISEEVEQYKKNGICDHIGKPFASAELWHCLLKHLQPVSVNAANQDNQAEADDILLKKMKTNFVKNNQTKYQEIVEAIMADDLILAHRLAHTLKTNAGIIGKTKLQTAAARLEAMLNEGNIPQAGQMTIVERELAIALEEYKPLLSITADPPAPACLNVGEARSLFIKLAPMLENINPACVDLLDEINAIAGTEELARQIEDYDFEAAVKTLYALMDSPQYYDLC
ncbi:MAG: ATP-binding protein, partial [Clostridiales bacterium]|nr:ATP-binding protein [Clostridiales bacterium]